MRFLGFCRRRVVTRVSRACCRSWWIDVAASSARQLYRAKNELMRTGPKQSRTVIPSAQEGSSSVCTIGEVLFSGGLDSRIYATRLHGNDSFGETESFEAHFGPVTALVSERRRCCLMSDGLCPSDQQLASSTQSLSPHVPSSAAVLGRHQLG